MTVMIGIPKAFTPRPPPNVAYVGAKNLPAHLMFPVLIINGGMDNYDPGHLVVSVQSGGAPGSRMVDSGAGYGGGPSTTVLPGRRVTFAIAFAIADPRDVVMDVRPDPAAAYQASVFATTT